MSIPVSAPTAYHGIVVSATGITGLYQTASAAQTCGLEVAALDNMGNTKVFEVCDFKSDVTLDVTYPTGTPSAILGDVVTVAGFKDTDLNGDYIVLSKTESASNVDFVKYNVTMRRFLQNAIPTKSV